jgi:RNA polymerase sigma factor (sigma-70 family)
MPTADELNDWMHAVAQTADRKAFAALFRHFAPRIKGFLLRCGSSEAQAEELAQEAMVVLWRRAATFDPARARLSTWLYTVARNLRISHLRRSSTAGEIGAGEMPEEWDADLQAADQQLGPDEQLLAAQREAGVRHALSALPADQALVLRLSFFEEQPHSQIAQDLGIPLGTVKSRIRLAVTQLRRRLEGFGP